MGITVDNHQLYGGQISAQTTVFVNLSNNQTGTARIGVNEPVTLAELGVDLADAPAPQLDAASLAAIATNGNLSADERIAKSKAIMAAYEKAAAAYTAGGGLSLQDRILAAVVKWLVSKHGFTTTDTSAQAKVLKPESLSLTHYTVNAPGGAAVVFNVTAVAVWG